MKAHLFKKSITILFLIISEILNLHAEHIVGFNADFGACFMALDDNTKDCIEKPLKNNYVTRDYTLHTSSLIPNYGFNLSYEYRNELKRIGIKTGFGMLFNNGYNLRIANILDEYRITTIEIPCVLTYTPNYGRKVEVTPFLGTYFSFPVGNLRFNNEDSKIKISTPLIPGFQLGFNTDVNLPNKLAFDFGVKYCVDFKNTEFKIGNLNYSAHRQNLFLYAGIKYKIGRNSVSSNTANNKAENHFIEITDNIITESGMDFIIDVNKASRINVSNNLNRTMADMDGRLVIINDTSSEIQVNVYTSQDCKDFQYQGSVKLLSGDEGDIETLKENLKKYNFLAFKVRSRHHVGKFLCSTGVSRGDLRAHIGEEFDESFGEGMKEAEWTY